MSASTRMARHWLARGQTAMQAGRRAEAIAALRQAVSADPDCVDALLWLAGLCDNPTDSLRLLTRALVLDPQNEAAHEGIRWARKRLHDLEQAQSAPLPQFLKSPVPPPVDRPQFKPVEVPLPKFEPLAAPTVRPAVNSPVPVCDERTSATVTSRQFTQVPARKASVVQTPVAPSLREVPSETKPHQSAAGVPALPASRRIVVGMVAVWAAIVIVLGAGIVWTVLQPPKYAAMVVTVPAAAPTPAAVAEAIATPSATATVPLQQPTADTTRVSAQRVNEILQQLDSLWANEQWDTAIPLITQALAIKPGDADLKQKLMSAYFNRAVAQMDSGELDDALKSYDQALAVVPDPQVKVERDALANYQSGVAQYNQRNWPATVQFLVKVYAQDAGYLDTRELLYRSYYNQGVALRAAKDLNGALKAYQAAVELDDRAVEARGELAQVKALLAPPPATPTPVPQAVGAKWIDVNITTQRFRAMRGTTTVYTFVTSTGEKGRDTQPGSYKILDKIPNAYSRFWKLWMPYWMGIYWAGSSENGIHALPILSNGATLWAGFLGRKVSFGCVILDTASAKLMFNWADIGTPVKIHY